MVVHGLQKYLDKECPIEVCRKVHLRKFFEDEDYCRGLNAPPGHGRKKAVLPYRTVVVDVNSCYSIWLKNCDGSIGFDGQKFIQFLHSFVHSFLCGMLDLIFFVGGVRSSNKRKLWLDSQIKAINDVKAMWDQINDDVVTYKKPVLPPNIETFITWVLKDVLQCKVEIAVEDCFQEILQYVRRNSNCIAIFSDDIDFVVCRKRTCLVFDAGSYDSHYKTVLLYDCQKLCQYLDIPTRRLPLIAALAGNDFLDYNLFTKFHHRVSRQPEKLIGDLVRYLTEFPKDFYTRPNFFLKKICIDVFGNCSRLDDLKRAYYYYCSEFENYGSTPCDSSLGMKTPKNEEWVIQKNKKKEKKREKIKQKWDPILTMGKELVQNGKLPVPIWIILKEQIYEMALGMENLYKLKNSNPTNKKKPSATLTRELRRRLYGILLYQMKDSKPDLVIEEWCGENPESFQEPVKVKPNYPKAHHPGLNSLWNPSEEERICKYKWNLFVECISTKLDDIELWKNLDVQLVVPAAALFYLYRVQSCLNLWELRAFQATLALYSQYDCKALDQLPKIKNKYLRKATRLSELFCQTYHIVFLIRAACGFPASFFQETNPYFPFEPKLFLMIYAKARRIYKSPLTKVESKYGADIDDLCNHQVGIMKIFNELTNTITPD